MKFQPYWYVILVLVAIIFLQRACDDDDCPPLKLLRSEKYVPEKVFIEITRDSAYPVPVIQWATHVDSVLVPADVDTALVIASYFRKLFYSDTISGLDTGLHYKFRAVINDSIYENEIRYRQFMFLDLKPTTINTFEVATPRNKLFIGGQIGGNIDHFDAGISLLLLTKKDHGYSYTYQAFSRTHNIGMYWKIGKR